jgi:glycine/D-amino acid oxidase-like deaminating enzyme
VTVGWDAELDRPGLPPLDGDTTADACVVGLGASGLAAVAELADRGLTVVGVDAGRIAAGAAGRNGGFLLGGGAPFLHDAIARWGQDTAVELYRATLGELARVPDGLVRCVGSLRLASDDAELTDCAQHAAALREHGFAVEEYAGELGQGLFLPDDAAINPVQRAMAMAGALAGRAQLYEHTRVSTVDAKRVVTDRGVISADAVIVAVDGRLELVFPGLADRVRTARLQMLATAPVPARLPCPVYYRWGYDYAQQLPDGRLFVGGGRDRFADDEWTLDATPTAPVQAWIEQVAHRLAGGAVGVTHRWAASVGYTSDGRPLCVEVAPRVVACGGYNGTGNLVGPLTARAAVALAVDGTSPPAWLNRTGVRSSA